MFGKRSRFEKAVAQEAQADFDFEIDLGDFGDGLSDENSGNGKQRKPILKATRDFGRGVKSSAFSKSAVEQFLKKALPKEYGNLADNIVAGKNDLVSGISDASSGLNKVTREARELARRAGVTAEERGLSKLSELLKKVAGEAEAGNQSINREDARENEISATLGSLFSAQERINQKRESIKAKKEEVKEAIESVRFDSQIKALGSIDKTLRQSLMFSNRTTFNYYRKSIELQLRQYHVLSDIYANQEKSNKELLTAINDIKLNTGLPDFVKMRSAEALKQMARQKAMNKGFESLFGQSSFLSNLAKITSNTVKQRIGSTEELLSELIGSGEMALNNLGDGSGFGPSAAESAGSLGATTLMGFLGGLLSSRMGKTKLGRKVGRGASKVARFNDNMGSILEQGFKSSRYRNNTQAGLQKMLARLTGRDADEFAGIGDGAFDRVFDFITPFITAANNDKNKIRITDVGGYRNFASPQGLSTLTQRAQAVVVPGYLARILQQITWLRTGKETKLLEYNYNSGKFMPSDKNKREIINQVIGSSINSLKNTSTSIMEDIGLSSRNSLGERSFAGGITDKDVTTFTRILLNASFSGEYITPAWLTNPSNFAPLGEKATLFTNAFKGKPAKEINRIINQITGMKANVVIDKDTVEGVMAAGQGQHLLGSILSQDKDGYSVSHSGIADRLGRYSSGGFTGHSARPGDRNEVAGTVHKNEVVFSQEDVKRWGGYRVVEALRRSSLSGIDKIKEAYGKGKKKLTENEKLIEQMQLLNDSLSTRLDTLGSLAYRQVAEMSALAEKNPHAKRFLVRSRRYFSTLARKTRGYNKEKFKDDLEKLKVLSIENAKNLQQEAMNPENYRKVAGDIKGFYEENKGLSFEEIKDKYQGKLQGKIDTAKKNYNYLKGFINKGKNKLFTRVSDLYHESSLSEPILKAKDVVAGKFRDESGKVITALNEVTGNIYDAAGNMVVSYEEFKESFTKGVDGTWKKVKEMSWFNNKHVERAKWLALGLGTMTFGAIVPMTYVAKRLYSTVGKDISNKYKGRLRDVYVRGDDKPALIARKLRLGHYAWVDESGGRPEAKVIKSLNDIKGPVIDMITQEYVITKDDLQRGLVDSKGRPIDMGLGRRLLNIPLTYAKWATRTIGGVLGKMGKGIGAITKVGFGMATGLLGGLIKGAAGAMGIGGRVRTVFDRIQSKIRGPEDMQYANLAIGDEGNRILMQINAQLANGAFGNNKKVLGDTDGDGDRENSIADIKQKAAQAAKDKLGEARENARFSKLANMIGKTVNGIGLGKDGREAKGGGGLMSMISGIAGQFIGGLIGKLGRGLLGLLGKIPGVGKLLGGLGMGGAAAGAAKGAGLLSRGLGFAGKGLGLAGAAYGAYSAYQNLKEGNYGAAALDGGLALAGVAMTPGLGGALMTGATFLATNPIGWAILGTAAVGYGAYKVWNYFKNNKINEPVIARMLQYGFKENEEDYMKKVMEFERLLGEATTPSGEIDRSALGKNLKDILKIFEIKEDDQAQIQKWGNWYNHRFSPVYKKAMAAVRSIKPNGTLVDATSFKDKDLDAYYTAITPSPGSYTIQDSPFAGHICQATGDDALKYIASKKGKNPEKSNTASNLSSGIKKVLGFTPLSMMYRAGEWATKKIAGAIPDWMKTGLKIAVNPLGMAVKGLMSMLGFNSKEEISASTGSTSGSSGDDKNYDATRSIIYKMFGLMNMNEFNKVAAVNSLMNALSSKIKWQGTRASFNEDIAEFAVENAGLFKIDKEDNGRVKVFTEYLKYRFVPIYLNLVSSTRTHIGGNTLDGLYRAQTSKKLIVLNEVLTAKIKVRRSEGSIWDYNVSPWDDKLNTNAKSIDEDLRKLENEVKSKDTNASKTEALAKTEKTKLNNIGIGTSAFDTIKNTIGGFVDSARNTIASFIPQGVKDAYNAATNAASGVVDSVTGAVGDAYDAAKDWVTTKLSGNNRDKFRTIMEAAVKAGEPHPAVLAAQWALESGWGKHQSGKNNYFGIKARPGEPGTMRRTREVLRGRNVMINDRFADYASLEDGIAARVAFIRENKRYTRGGYYSASTPEQAAVALQRSGYATDPNYARALIGLMRGAGIDTTKPSSETAPAVSGGKFSKGGSPNGNAGSTPTRTAVLYSAGTPTRTATLQSYNPSGSGSLQRTLQKVDGTAMPSGLDSMGVKSDNTPGVIRRTLQSSMVNVSKKAQAAAAKASARALGKSAGKCARYVREALQSAGYKFTPQPSAYMYHTKGILAGMGFTQMSPDTPEAPGDVIVWGPIPGHPHGHIQIYDGKTWVSDFRHRRDLSPYGQSPHKQCWYYRDTGGETSTVATGSGGGYAASVANVSSGMSPAAVPQAAKPSTEDKTPLTQSRPDLFQTTSVANAMGAFPEGTVNRVTGTGVGTGVGEMSGIDAHVESLQASLRNLLGIGRADASTVVSLLHSTKQNREAMKKMSDANRESLMRSAMANRNDNPSLLGRLLGFSNSNTQDLRTGLAQSGSSTSRREAEIRDVSNELLKETKEQTKTLKEILAEIRGKGSSVLSPSDKVSYRNQLNSNSTNASPVTLAKGNI
nr:MAG TPA: Muramidase (flagellum-specific) [Caudoviricetes sp.]